MSDTTGTTGTQDPAAIEQDIRRTQEDMSRTVDRIGDQLTPRKLIDALLDQADSNNIDARKLLDGARRNPLALAMIAGGAIWLVSDNDAKFPKLPARSHDADTSGHTDPHHRDYVSHMEKVNWNDGEDDLAYQRRRDIARANFFMVERRHDEDESGFRQRLDDVAEKFRARRQAWSEQGQRARAAAGESGRAAVSRAQSLYTSTPLVGGLAAAAVGAAFGALLPITETEQEQLSGVGEKARELAGDQKDKLAEVVREKKDALVAKVEQSTGGQQAGGQQPGGQQLGGQQASAGTPQASTAPGVTQPVLG